MDLVKINKEVWKPVKDYEGLYEVSSLGRVRGVDRIVKHSFSGTISIKGKIKNQLFDKKGYLRVSVCKNGRQKTRLTHQLVAEAFMNHDRCGMKLVINHIDHDKSNNTYINLEITTHKDNCEKRNKHYGINS